MGNRVNNQIQALQELDQPNTNAAKAGALAAASSAMGKLNRAGPGIGNVSTEQAQQVTNAAAQKAAKGTLTASAQGAANTGQVNQMVLGQQQQAAQKTLADREQAIGKANHDQQQRLARMSMDLSQQLHDDTMQFKKDELGRVVLNEKQMLDYAILKAKSAEELENYKMLKEQILQRKQAVMKQAYAVIAQKLQQITEMEMQQDATQFSWEQQQENQKLKEFLALAKKRAQDKIDASRREGAKSAAWAGVASAGIGVLSAINPAVGAAAAVGYAAYTAAQ